MVYLVVLGYTPMLSLVLLQQRRRAFDLALQGGEEVGGGGERRPGRGRGRGYGGVANPWPGPPGSLSVWERRSYCCHTAGRSEPASSPAMNRRASNGAP